MQRKTWRSLAILTLFALPFAGACGGGGDGGGGDGGGGGTPGDCAAPTVDVTGVWTVNATDSVTSSNPPGYCTGGSDSYNLTLTQDTSGNATAIDGDGHSYSGKVCGNILYANTPFSYSEDGGVTTITSLVITITGNSFNSTASWTWVEDGGTGNNCGGTSTASGSK